MKLLYIVSASYRGGATLSFISLVKGLKAQGVECEVVTPEKGFLNDTLALLDVPVHIVPVQFAIWPPCRKFKDVVLFLPRLLKQLIVNQSAVKAIRKIACRFRPDIIHTNVSVIDVGYRAAHSLHIPHVWHIREYADLDFALHLFPSSAILHRRLATPGSYAIAITDGLAQYRSLGDNATVIYNAVEPPANYQNIGLQGRDNLLIHVGLLSKNKGVDDIVEAFSAIRNDYPETCLKLIGRGNPVYLKELRERIDRLGLSNAVEIIGPREDVYSIMQSARAIIVASKCEGFGRITAEAMLNGCLVIGRNTGGTKEQADNGLKFTGQEIVLRFDDIPALTNRMREALEMTPDKYVDLTKRAGNTAATLYNPQQNVESTLQLYNKILK